MDKQKKYRKDQARRKERVEFYRRSIFALIGSKCVRCGSEIDLKIHHVDGQGSKDRLSHKSGSPAYLKAILDKAIRNTSAFQVICNSCDALVTNETKLAKILDIYGPNPHAFNYSKEFERQLDLEIEKALTTAPRIPSSISVGLPSKFWPLWRVLKEQGKIEC